MSVGPTGMRHGLMYARLTLGWSMAIASASAAISDATSGSSPIPVGAGPRALGMGGAFTAVADDASAATWNPAGMVQLERFELGASLGWYHRRTRQEDGSSDQRDDIDLDHVSAILPFHAFGCQQTVGVAWQRQFDFGRAVSSAAVIDTDVEQEVDIEVEGAISSLGLSYAIELRPGLSLGVTVQAWSDALTGRSSYTRDMRELVTDSGDEFRVHDHMESEVAEGYNTVIGLWWQALPALTVGVVVKPSYELRIETTQDVHLSGPGYDIQAPREHLSADLHYPTSATLGLAWRHGDRDTIACDTTWTQWSRYRISEDGTSTSPVNAYIPYGDFSDGIAIRLGYEHLALFDEMVIALRIGALYEELPGAAPAPSVLEPESTHAVVDRYYGVTVGMSLCFEHLLYDLGAQVRHGDDVGTDQDAPPDSTADVTTVTVRLGVAYQF